MSIDHAVVENVPLFIMGDFNIDYLTPREQQNLVTVILPYGLTVIKTKEPTRVKGQSRSLIDYIILDHFDVDYYTSFVSDTPLRTTKNEPIDHLATSVVSNIENKSFKKVIQKEIFDKRTYQKNYFKSLVETSDWSYFYAQNCPECMFSVFMTILESALRKSIKKKKVFIRNDKSDITINQKWISSQTKRLYNNLSEQMQPNDTKYHDIQCEIIENIRNDRNKRNILNFGNLKSEREKWNFIKEARTSRRTCTVIPLLKIAFGDCVSEPKKDQPSQLQILKTW